MGKVIHLDQCRRSARVPTGRYTRGIGTMLRKKYTSIDVLRGQVLTSIKCFENPFVLVFETKDGGIYRMESSESGHIAMVSGFLGNLLGSPLTSVEVVPAASGWTCQLATEKGSVKIEWWGKIINFVQFVPG